jgi:lysophospholipase L1-like esterase
MVASIRRLALVATGGIVSAGIAEVIYVRRSFRLPPSPSGPISGVERHDGLGDKGLPRQENPSEHTATQRRHVVFLGDSTATGTGCSEEAGTLGAVMPRACASLVARRLGQDVSWAVVGTVGADVPTASHHLSPLLEQQAARLRCRGESLDAVVLLCGLNDVKSCFLPADLHFETRAVRPFDRHPRRFGEDLERLIGRIREVAGEQCVILVPEEPMAESPRFASLWPLCAAIRLVSSLWDGEKRQACSRAAAIANRDRQPSLASNTGGVLHVAMPPILGPSFFSVDGMHPNDRGYQAWGELLATILLGKQSRSYIPELGLDVQIVTTPS